MRGLRLYVTAQGKQGADLGLSIPVLWQSKERVSLRREGQDLNRHQRHLLIL
jgi:hypothetical protein